MFKQNKKEEKKMDNKAARRKIFKTPEAKEFDSKRNIKETMQECLDRMGYETPKDNQSADDYVKSLGW